MKKFLFSLSVFLLFCLATFTSSNLKAQQLCPNADFSYLNFTNWTGKTGTCCPLNINTPGIVNGRHTIMATQGQDANTNFQLNFIPPGYTQSCRLGNDNVGYEAESISYTITVDSSNALFIYSYAVVLQDPNHQPNIQPRFDIQVTDSLGNVIPCTYYHVVANASIPGFQTYGNVRWKNWTQNGVSLLSFIGQTMTITATTSDCGAGGHFGYAYIAAKCQPMVIDIAYCIGDTLATLTAPIGFTYQWSTGQTSQSIVITNPQANPNITCTLTSPGGCVATLQVNVSVAQIYPGFLSSNQCDGCVGFTDTTWLNYGYVTQYTWDFGDGDSAFVANPTHCYDQPGNYNVHLSVVSNGGCVNDSTFQITAPSIMKTGFVANINTCDLTQSFTDTSYIIGPDTIIAWKWKFGDGDTAYTQNPTHTFPQSGNYTVTLYILGSDSCLDSAVTNITIYPSYADSQSVTICEGDNYTLPGGQVVSAAGIYSDTLSSIYGCDSVIKTNLLHNPTYNINNNPSICFGESYTLPGGGTVSTTGTYVDTFSTYKGCDSLITTNLTVNPILDTVIDPSICQGETFTLPDGSITNTPGTYYDTLTTVGGCDSLVTTNLSWHPNPVADFNYDPNCFGITKFMQNVTSGTPEFFYTWDLQNDLFPDTNAGSFTYQYKVTNDTTLQVHFSVTDSKGCKADTIKTISIKGGITKLIMPNILIVNSVVAGNEKLNFETFAPGFNACVNYTLRVYNRWGNLVFETQNQTTLPDLNCSECFVGQKQSGISLSEGVYYYVLIGIDIDGNEHEYNGTLQLVDAK